MTTSPDPTRGPSPTAAGTSTTSTEWRTHSPRSHTNTVHDSPPGPPPRASPPRGWHVADLNEMENSLPAFRRAAEEGYRYLEPDVHAPPDGVVVAHHDDRLDRTTDATGQVAQ